MECTLTGFKKKKGSLFLAKINEWNSVQSQSNLNFSGSPSCFFILGATTRCTLDSDIISPQAQVDIYFAL